MKRVVASALLVLGLGFLPAYAQRGGSRGGGFSGHSAPSFHGSFGSSGRTGFTSAPRVAGGGYARMSPAFAARRPVFPGSRGGVIRLRPGGGRPYRGGYSPFRGRRRGYIGVPLVGVNGWNSLGYPDSSLDTGAGDPQDYAAQPDNGPATEEGQAAPIPYMEAPPRPSGHVAKSAPVPDEEAVTIIFKDNRPPMQIHNYMMNSTTLYVRDQKAREFPLADLDLEATVRANHDAGVDFQVPVTNR